LYSLDETAATRCLVWITSRGAAILGESGGIINVIALRKFAGAGRVLNVFLPDTPMPLASPKTWALFLLISLMSACAALPPTQTQLKETDDLAEVVQDALALSRIYGKDQVLVVFDIDNTLLAMEQDLGSDQWYDWQKKLQSQDPCSGMVVSDRLAVQGALYFSSAMRPTQPNAAELVQQLQNEGVSVIAVTSRGSDFRLQTYRELRRNHMSLWATALPPRRGYQETFIPAGGSRPALYEDGAFLTAGQHKGDMLKALLIKTGHSIPSVVVFADDKEYNLQNVLDTYAGSDTAIHAWRYSREDSVVAAFNDTLVDEQWNALRPALQQIQQIMGPDNFDFPQYVTPEGCSGM
jgi:hypothetical protein